MKEISYIVFHILIPQGVRHRLAKLKFRKSGVFYQKTGVYQENFFYNSGEKSGGFLFEVKGTLGGFLDYIHLIS